MENTGFSFAPTFEEISARAYQFFEDEERPEGKHEEHWTRAEKVLMEEMNAKRAAAARPAAQKESRRRP